MVGITRRIFFTTKKNYSGHVLKKDQNPVIQTCIQSHKYTSESCATIAEHKSHGYSWNFNSTSVPKYGF